MQAVSNGYILRASQALPSDGMQAACYWSCIRIHDGDHLAAGDVETLGDAKAAAKAWLLEHIREEHAR
jgi:hypothetical protein